MAKKRSVLVTELGKRFMAIAREIDESFFILNDAKIAQLIPSYTYDEEYLKWYDCLNDLSEELNETWQLYDEIKTDRKITFKRKKRTSKKRFQWEHDLGEMAGEIAYTLDNLVYLSHQLMRQGIAHEATTVNVQDFFFKKVNPIFAEIHALRKVIKNVQKTKYTVETV